MIAKDIAIQRKNPNELIELARYFALINLSLADAGISAWEAKYWYNYPRPISLIRKIPATLNPQAQPNKFWTPLGAPVTNSVASKNFTPPFPAYPSGHAVFGAALFQTLRRFYSITNDAESSFTFHSDEYNGENKSARLNTRRSLTSRTLTFDTSEWENAQSRIWLGIHWQFDADNGIKQGRQVGNFVFDHVYTKP
ncbi:vanadium-dependent haloperoxidase [Spirosoma foliorum]|uniref:Vanadium-dependent haloperoxidase n=1 Tax=Spirosoma foliorum TaxID=2710596 RepID=A0A7G5H6F1_9BACT|nr:vanadium-dependent haloperoxidase [Spirosoma foliorum]QMW06693.1 vanadium-dependent haloperoxidase [Spirosoma foliorum]